MSDTPPALLEFPCDFPIKVMGRTSPEFQALMIELVRRHAPDLDENLVRVQESRGGRYLAVTLNIRATSKAQLDAIYRELSRHEQVVMAL
ncbi:MAG TPA: DUF493 domain-containing protein [Candidatus Competibacteraceae bacterium]|nr:DUF493 domain-containing protein [Candidatus Competibacteraceae bacterium]